MSVCRYSSKGEKRKATEAELILCNLSIRRNIFEANGGFNERLFPNEENEFLQRLKENGYSLIYEPEAKVFRYPEKSLFRFLKHIFNYGRGRSEQFFIKRHLSFIFHLIPFLFFCYIIILFLNINWWLTLPLLVYLVLNLFFSYKKARIKKNYIYLLFLPPLFFLLHLSYGIGIFYGIFSSIFKIKRASFFSEVNVKIIKSFDEE
jgi:GT2 family glycosyltransferase